MELTILTITGVILIIATIYDLKGRYVADYASYSFISIALLTRVLYAMEHNNWSLLSWSLTASAGLFMLGYALYKGGMWGGGDVKIMISVALLISHFPNETIPMIISFFTNLTITGAVYVYVTTMIIGLRKQQPTNKEKTLMILGSGAAITIMALQPTMMNALLAFGILITSSLTYLKKIETNHFTRPANMKTLMDGDWLTHEVRVGRKVIKPRKEGLTRKEAALIKKWYSEGKIDKPIIKEGLPYLPAFLLSYVVTLTSGNILVNAITQGLI